MIDLLCSVLLPNSCGSARSQQTDGVKSLLIRALAPLLADDDFHFIDAVSATCKPFWLSEGHALGSRPNQRTTDDFLAIYKASQLRVTAARLAKLIGERAFILC